MWLTGIPQIRTITSLIIATTTKNPSTEKKEDRNSHDGGVGFNL